MREGIEIFQVSSSGTHYFKIGERMYQLSLGYMPGLPQSGRMVPLTEGDWSEFLKVMDQLDVWNWSPRNLVVAFPEREGAAGCGVPHVQIMLVANGQSVLLQSSNRFPPKWGEFCAAIAKLFAQGTAISLSQAEVGIAQDQLAVFDSWVQNV